MMELSCQHQCTVWVKQISPLWGFWNFSPNKCEFLSKNLYTYYAFISMPYDKISFNYDVHIHTLCKHLMLYSIRTLSSNVVNGNMKTLTRHFRIRTVQTFISAGRQAKALGVGRVIGPWWFRRTDSQWRNWRRWWHCRSTHLTPVLSGTERHLVSRLKLPPFTHNT